MPTNPEVWMRGPVANVNPWLQPVVHSLLQTKEEIESLAERLTDEELWQRPGGAASIGYHLDHIGGSLDRLFTYARGEMLSPAQFAALKEEGLERGRRLREVIDGTKAAIDRAVEAVKATPYDTLLAARKIGRAGLPTTTLGLLFHGAEHSLRHSGQAITTVKQVVRAT